MAGSNDSDLIISKRKAINTLFPHAIFLEQGGRQGMIDAILRTARVSDSKTSNCGKFMWHHVMLYISRLFEKRSPAYLDRVITFIAPYVPWNGAFNNRIPVTRWAAAASTIQYTEEVGQAVVVALFQIAFIDLLRPHIPIGMWGWVKKQPPLPTIYSGRLDATRATVVAYVRRLGDIDILKSYLFLIWTDRCIFHSNSLHEMESSIREDFSGIGMEHHRKDLLDGLNHILGDLDLERVKREVETQYTKLRDLLLEIDKQ